MTANTHNLNLLTGLLADRGWDQLLLYGHTWRKDYFRYLLNFNFSGPHALAALSRSGEIQVLVSHPWDFENLSSSWNGKVTLACNFQAGVAKLAGKVKNSKLAVAGLEIMEARFLDGLNGKKPPVSATFEVEELRRVKNPEEIELVKQAAELSDRGYEHFVRSIEVGMTEYELVAEVEGFLKANGAEDNFMLIGSGGTELMGMKPPSARKFQAGDSVTTELTPQVDGYWAQICRTLVLGEPSAKQRESFAIFSEAQKAAEDLIKPGVDISDVARVQNDVFRKHGYGEYTGSKYTRVRGHNLGLHPDENPYVLEDVHYIVKEGMVVIAHPNTYLPLSGYMVFGDSLLITAGGSTCLNSTERKLFQK